MAHCCAHRLVRHRCASPLPPRRIATTPCRRGSPTARPGLSDEHGPLHSGPARGLYFSPRLPGPSTRTVWFCARCPFKPPKQSGRCWTVSSPDVAGVPRVRPWRGALGTAAETLEGLSGFRVYVDAARQHASVQSLRRTVGAALDPCVGPRQPGGVLGTGDVDALPGYY